MIADNELPDDELPDDELPDDELSDNELPDDELPDNWPDDELPDNDLPDDWPDDDESDDDNDDKLGGELPDGWPGSDDEPDLEKEKEEEEEEEEVEESYFDDNNVKASYKNYMKKLASQNYARNNLYKENLNSKTVMHKIATSYCDGCNNPNNEEVEAVECQDCHAVVVLCSRDQRQNFCPACADMKKTALRLAKKEIYSSNKDYGDELCVPPGGMPWGGKDNGDGNFRVEKKKDNDNSKEVLRLKKALADEKVNSARLVAASRAAARMAERGLIEEDEIEEQINMFTESGMSVNAINSFEKQALRLAMKQDKNRARNASVKTASKNVGIATNYGMPTSQDSPVDMKKQLRDIFMAKYDEYEKKNM